MYRCHKLNNQSVLIWYSLISMKKDKISKYEYAFLCTYIYMYICILNIQETFVMVTTAYQRLIFYRMNQSMNT